MYLCRVIMADDVVFRRGTHVSGTDPRFDPEEQLASAVADFGRVLAKMKCPSNYLSGLIKYVLTSSILPAAVTWAHHAILAGQIMEKMDSIISWSYRK